MTQTQPCSDRELTLLGKLSPKLYFWTKIGRFFSSVDEYGNVAVFKLEETKDDFKSLTQRRILSVPKGSVQATAHHSLVLKFHFC